MRRERSMRLDIWVMFISFLLSATLLSIGTYKLVTAGMRQLDKLNTRLEQSHACSPDHDHDCAWRDD